MTTTPRLAITDLTSAQAVPETTVNQAVRTVEQGASAFIIKDKDLATPPGSPADGDAYIVASTPTGAWVGHTGDLAFYLSTAWVFIDPIEGTVAYAQDENAEYRYDGAAWVVIAAATTPDYQFGLFFTTTPTASEVLLLHIAAEAFTIPANFTTPTSKGVIGTNPTGSFAIDVQRQVNATGAFATIGTITISTGGVFTFATSSGTAKAIAVNDVLKFIGPAADATAANMAITVRATR